MVHREASIIYFSIINSWKMGIGFLTTTYKRAQSFVSVVKRFFLSQYLRLSIGMAAPGSESDLKSRAVRLWVTSKLVSGMGDWFHEVRRSSHSWDCNWQYFWFCGQVSNASSSTECVWRTHERFLTTISKKRPQFIWMATFFQFKSDFQLGRR